MAPDSSFDFFDASYLYPPPTDRSGPLFSPGLASDTVLLEALPDWISIITCSGDQLLAEGEVFRERLKGWDMLGIRSRRLERGMKIGIKLLRLWLRVCRKLGVCEIEGQHCIDPNRSSSCSIDLTTFSLNDHLIRPLKWK
jgi:hypothetical protein